MTPSIDWLSRALPILIGWFTLALVNAGLAQGKGRRGALWFLLSILFGPLATLAVVVLAPPRRKLF